ncbi:hypothetical protein AC579_9289 [Pseudocercospora musae]|uniref:RING-type domain-containing protein n=1 Tax=Pseudocercospora musae TaxID=113226 RepID=A0A139I580_9PEZI|nr:hypothetical protein AC579_9289 [Pseudocercospora musae]
MPPLSIYPTTRMDKISSSSWEPLRATRPAHRPQSISTCIQLTNFEFAPTTTATTLPQSKCKAMQPGALLLLQSPTGSYLVQISTTSPLTGHVLRPYDWESLIQFGTYSKDTWDRCFLSESALDTLLTQESDATIEPSPFHLASIGMPQRRYYVNHPKASPTAILRYEVYKKLQQLDLQETCAICRLPYQNIDILKGLDCGHVFHDSCMNEVMKVWKGACPYCGYT